MRVLIVKVSALGDVIHTLPVLDYLQRIVPGIEIDWVVEERNAPLLADNPLISQLHLVRTRAWRDAPFARKTWREIGMVKRRLRERRYDIVFDLQGNLKSGLITWLVGCDRRYGYSREEVREPLNLLFTTNQVPLRKQDRHVTARALRLVGIPFAKDYQGLQLQTDVITAAADDAAAEAILATLADDLVFLFHPGTTWQTKLWHEAGWIELGKQILQHFPQATILLSWGGERERLECEQIVRGIGRAARLVPGLSLKELAALLKKVDLVVAGDTGPLHLAAAVGTPTVSFYRVTDGRRNGPQGEQHILVQAPLHCTGCLNKECDRDKTCRESITPEMIMKGVVEVLGG